MLSTIALFTSVLALQSGGFDTAAAAKWEAAKVISYHVEDVHNARAMIVFGDYEGKADVLDRITVEFTWDAQKEAILGPVKVTDRKTELKNLKSDGTNCPLPELLGDYEHFQSVSTSITNGHQVQISGTHTYPAAKVSNYPGSCSMRSIAGAKEQALAVLGGANPGGHAMPMTKGGPITIAADRKTFFMTGAEHWVWTFTPTLVRE